MLAEKSTRVDPEFSAAPDSGEDSSRTNDESPALTRALRALPPALRSIIAHPDYAAARQDPHFFDPGPGCFHSPLLIPGMEEAVEILRATIESRGRMLVLGDRDVDGVSSTALLGNFLRDRHEKKGGGLELVVSDDGDDYGLSGDLFDRIREGDADLVILLDMGSSHGPEVNQLLERGKQVIILDHHQLHDRIPEAALDGLAFVNPCRDADVVCALEHDGKIATVGLVFKLLLAYGLSFTKEWQRAFYYPDAVGGAVSAYRCGCFLGRFVDLAAGQAAFPDLEWCDLTESYALAAGDLEFFTPGIDAEPAADRQLFDARGLTAGKIVLGYMIRSRPRLLEFVQRTADLAAVGIITDMVPLVGENRALVRLGIGQSGFPRRGERPYSPGYEALIGALGLPADRVVSRDLSWSIGPALNAAGRMGNTRLALDLLTCEDRNEARQLAKDLVKLNEDRKKRTARNETVVARHFEEHPELLEQPILFCYHEDLEPGVSGIVATRLVERHHKPVVYINRDGKHAKGSTRTHAGLNVLKLLDTAAELFVQFGGHPEAAGFSIHYDRIPELEQALQAAAPAVLAEHAAAMAGGGNGESGDEFHLELQPADLGYELLRDVELLEPFGSGNPEPVFCLRDVHPAKIKYMTDGLHARFQLRGAPSHVDCVAWRLGARIAQAAENKLPVTLYGSLEMSYFAGRSRLQFRVERLKAASDAAAEKLDF
ncbi:MAG: DHHA1 domain-containing protein [bacterium]|nr:DHHA1 domain-containing protein [bacterium]